MNLKGSTSTRPGQPCASGFFDVPCCHLLEVSPSYRSQTTICFTFGRDASIQREQLGLTGNLLGPSSGPGQPQGRGIPGRQRVPTFLPCPGQIELMFADVRRRHQFILVYLTFFLWLDELSQLQRVFYVFPVALHDERNWLGCRWTGSITAKVKLTELEEVLSTWKSWVGLWSPRICFNYSRAFLHMSYVDDSS